MGTKLFINVKDTIFESKSQPTCTVSVNPLSCLSMSKIQFLKANHNDVCPYISNKKVVYQCQRYNFWKQITTVAMQPCNFCSCLSMSKIQFLKANHNNQLPGSQYAKVVYQCQRYNFWKQITTTKIVIYIGM